VILIATKLHVLPIKSKRLC